PNALRSRRADRRGRQNLGGISVHTCTMRAVDVHRWEQRLNPHLQERGQAAGRTHSSGAACAPAALRRVRAKDFTSAPHVYPIVLDELRAARYHSTITILNSEMETMSENCNHDCSNCSANCASREGAAPDFSAKANAHSRVKKV